MRGWLVLVFVVACRKSEQAAPAPPPLPKVAASPAKSVRKASVDEALVVVVPDCTDVDALATRAGAKLGGFGGRAEAQLPVSQDYVRALSIGNDKLTKADLDALGANAGIKLTATGEPVATLRALSTAALDLAREQHGWVIDPATHDAYTAAQFEPRVPGDPVDVTKLIYVHAVVGDNKPPFLDTAGMQKLGLPELRVSVAASGQLHALTTLIDATAQAMLARDVAVPGTLEIDMTTLPGEWHLDDVKQRGGSGKIQWRLAWTKDPDSGEQQVELVPAAGPGVEGAFALIDECLGKDPAPTTERDRDDPELAAAAAKARAELVRRRSHYARGVPAGERLQVKAPFRDGDRVEWMWVDVVSWKADAFEGTLDNEPEWVKNVRLGQTVRVELGDVADFLAFAPDGTKAGGYSAEVLNKREDMR